jgi:hypothetical protein
LDARLDALAATVCENDPRTKRQRRSDACGSLGRGEATLACQCGSVDCPAAAVRASAASAVIHLLAEQSTVDGTSDNPGYLPGFGVMPAESVRRIAARAQLKPLTVPADTVTPDPGYRPSAKTKEFVRWRDLTCRWPGCDKPVEKSDIDHTVPYPLGPTHPSNNKHYCRVHHLIKTYFPGWTDEQMPDGTIILRAPSGHVYTTEPHGAAMFPELGRWTGELNLPEVNLTERILTPDPDRSVMMPRRKKTREQARRERIDAERRQRIDLNAELAAEQQRQQQARIAENDIPPPF